MKMNIKININSFKNLIAYLVALLFLIRPPYLATFGAVANVYRWGLPIVSVVIFIYYLVHCVLKKVSPVSIAIILYIVVPIIFAVVMGINILSDSYWQTPLTILSLSMLLSIGFRYHFKEMITALTIVLVTFVVINFATIILFPNALYSSKIYGNTNWFLGYKNIMVRTIIPALASYAIYSVYKHNRFTVPYLLFFVICLLSEILTDCKTGIIGVIIFAVVLFVFRINRFPRWVNLKNIAGIILIVSILFVATDITSLFSDYIASMNEEGSINNRLALWDRSISLFKSSPLIGYGYRSNDQMTALLSVFSNGNRALQHPHNYLLYILLQGGLFLFAIVTYIYVKVSNLCVKHKDNFVSAVIIAFFTSFLLMGLTESLVGAVLFIPMFTLSETLGVNKVEYKKIKIRFKL